MNLIVIETCKMNMRRYPTNPNTTADKEIIVKSLCNIIKEIIEGKLKKELRLCRPLGRCAFHIGKRNAKKTATS